MTTNSRTYVDADALAAPELGAGSMTDPTRHRVTLLDDNGHEVAAWVTLEQAGKIALGWTRLIGEIAWREYGLDGSFEAAMASPGVTRGLMVVHPFQNMTGDLLESLKGATS